MSTSAKPAGHQRLVAAIGIVLIVVLASLIVALRIARDSTPARNGALSADAAAARAASRVARVRQLFIDIKGRDPAGWDEANLRRWTQSPLGTQEIARRLGAERTMVGVHYFTWYRPEDDEWGNNATAVPAGAPKPALGWYDSTDPDVMDAHISQMAAAGFDFVILNLVAESPDSWAVTTQFFNRLRGK